MSIEIVKVCQVYFIHQDVELHDAETGSQLQCRALNITEDLGQIQYIFSDKTGTLTENRMVFRRCVVSGVEYSHDANGESARGRPGSALRPGRTAPPPTAASEADRRRTGGGQHRASAWSRPLGDSVGRVGGCIRFVRFIKPRTKTTASALNRRLRAVPLAVRRGCRRNEHAVMVSPPALAVSSCNASARGRKPCSYEL